MLKPSSLSWPRPTPFQANVISIMADYVALTKPPIVLLLLITALGGMFLGSQGAPPISVALLLLVGGAAAAGGASAINHYLDRDVDKLMARTCRRPLPGQRISPGAALAFGVVLNIFAFVLLVTGVNLLSALLTLSGTLFYVFVYTWWLKRSTPQNIVIGGAAGSIPPLAGWAAVTGGLELPAIYLFAIIFFWTPPHFWALALLIRDDYARAGIPMLPVIRGIEATQRQIMIYTVVVVAFTLLLFFTTGSVGWIYLASATVLGAIFLYMAWRLAFAGHSDKQTGGEQNARSLYLYSLLYLALLFTAVMVDSVVNI